VTAKVVPRRIVQEWLPASGLAGRLALAGKGEAAQAQGVAQTASGKGRGGVLGEEARGNRHGQSDTDAVGFGPIAHRVALLPS